MAVQLRHLLQRAHAFTRDLGADAITRQYGNACLHRSTLITWWRVLLVRLDGRFIGQQVTQLVHAMQQAVARERFDGKPEAASIGQLERGRLDLDGHCRARIGQQPVQRGVVDDHRHQAILERVGTEDVGELTADDGADAKVQQRPGRMFARGAAAEVAPTHQHRAAAGFGTIEHEIRIGLAVGQVAPVREQLLPQAFA